MPTDEEIDDAAREAAGVIFADAYARWLDLPVESGGASMMTGKQREVFTAAIRHAFILGRETANEK
jgi:hypothetical protein